ncbi:MAG: hypothetical protein ACOYJ2_07215 [Rickettsiales bacterium]
MQPTESEPSQHFTRAYAVCTAIIRAAKAGGTSEQDALLEAARTEIAVYNGFIEAHGQNDGEVWKGQKAAEKESGERLKPFFRDTGLPYGKVSPYDILASIVGTNRVTVRREQKFSGKE